MRRMMRTASLVLAMGATTSLAAGVATGHPATGASSAKAKHQPVVAPYLDMGANQPQNLYSAIKHAGLKKFSAGFVIGKKCTPTWDDGVAISKDPDVNDVITHAGKLGASVIVSFGGQGGKDLARTCTSHPKLVAAYDSVIKRFKVYQLDFDIEGDSGEHGALADTGAWGRRFDAIHSLEKKHPALRVSLTEPVSRTGLYSYPGGNVIGLLKSAKRHHVRVDVLNLMTMDYYDENGGASGDMGDAAISAARAALKQFKAIWPKKTYANLGITPMIGINDDAAEVFDLSDAADVRAFAVSHHVGRLAFWAEGRDAPCAQPETAAQENCSGVDQSKLDFTRAFLGEAAG